MANSQNTEGRMAPWLTIPDNDIISIEHPCIIKNRSKAIDMLGGPQQLAQTLEQGTEQSLAISFQPNDPASKTILSIHNDTSNILLKVTVPKRTGRKRKRETGGDFVEDTLQTQKLNEATHLIEDLLANPNQSNLEAVGNIKSCHVWRAMPDFAYFTKSSNFMRSIESKLLPQQYPLLKQWSLPRTHGLEDTEVIPPQVFSTQSLTHNYTYRQNPAVKAVADPTTGNVVLHNNAAPLKLHIQILMFDELNYPTAPSPDCPPLEEQSQLVKDLVKQLHQLFEDRPIWTRRALINSLPLDILTHLVGVAAAYVCYSLRSGPWRDAYVKFGIDPRSDPKYRKYQTILLQLVAKDKVSIQNRGPTQKLWSRSTDTESHIFTGKQAVNIDGKTWQLCDLKDPVLKELVDVPDLYLRPKCEIRYFGWYANGTIAKLRVLLKAKIDGLAEGKPVDSEMLQNFLQLPESWLPKAKASGPTDPASGYLPEGSSAKEFEWASAYRSICRTSAGGVPTFGGGGVGRTNKPKPKARPSYIGFEDDLDAEILDTNEQPVDEMDVETTAQYAEPDEVEDNLMLENEGSVET